MERKLWSEEEMILSLALYYKLPFGRLNQRTTRNHKLVRKWRKKDNSTITTRQSNTKNWRSKRRILASVRTRRLEYYEIQLLKFGCLA